jgi:hypothetical protein
MGRGKFMININVALQNLVSSTKCFCPVLFYIERYFESFAVVPVAADIDPLCSGRIFVTECL